MYVETMQRLQSLIDNALLVCGENEFGVAPLDTHDYVQYENMNFVVPSPTGTYTNFWADVQIDFGELSQIGMSAGNRYDLKGTARVFLRCQLNRGDAFILGKSATLMGQLHNATNGIVRLFDAVHSPVMREEPWWVAEVAVPFESRQNYALPSNSFAGTAALLDWHNAIRTKVKTFADANGLGSAFDNMAYSPQSGQGGSAWLNCMVIDRTMQILRTGGTKRRRAEGTLRIMVNGFLGQGLDPNLAVADLLATEFRAVSVSKVRYGVPQIQTIGRVNQWWVTQFDVPFRVDEVS